MSSLRVFFFFSNLFELLLIRILLFFKIIFKKLKLLPFGCLVIVFQRVWHFISTSNLLLLIFHSPAFFVENRENSKTMDSKKC